MLISSLCTQRARAVLNHEQLQTAQDLTPALMSQGYPGTGKTKTLAASVLFRFHRLLQMKSGWILCTTTTNTAALNILHAVTQYSCLAPFVRHKYSGAYKAFHSDEFKVAESYRVTPKMRLGSHGIMICTLGSFNGVVQQFPHLKDRIFDLVVDEGGQIWEFDFLRLMWNLPKLMRWAVFGDKNQMTPYITKLLKDDRYFPSIMTLMSQDDNHKSIELKIQYRWE